MRGQPVVSQAANLGKSEQSRPTKASYQERPYQTAIVKRTIEFLYEGRDGKGDPIESVLIEAPTGAGKTVVALMAAREAAERGARRIAWVAMRRNLLTNAARENVDKGFGLDIQFISMFQNEGLPAEGEVDLLIVDEAHHDACETMASLHKRLRPARLIGLSATPYRTDRAGLCFKKQVKEAGIYQLVREGWLASYEHYTIKSWTPESVARVYMETPEKWGKSIVFFRTVEQCEEAASILRGGGHIVEVVTGGSDKEAQLEAFENGDVRVLLNCMVLTEGFDCPSLETAFVRPSAKGPTTQMAGRALRKADGIQKKIVQCQATKAPFTKIAPAAAHLILNEDTRRWQPLNPDARIEEKLKEMRRVIANAPVDVESLSAITNSPKVKKSRRNFRRG